MMKSCAFAPRFLIKYGAVELKPIGKSLAMVVYRGYFGAQPGSAITVRSHLPIWNVLLPQKTLAAQLVEEHHSEAHQEPQRWEAPNNGGEFTNKLGFRILELNLCW
jgi:hypothetical protein